MVGTSAFSRTGLLRGRMEVQYEIICGNSPYSKCLETVYD